MISLNKFNYQMINTLFIYLSANPQTMLFNRVFERIKMVCKKKQLVFWSVLSKIFHSHCLVIDLGDDAL